MQFKNIDQVSFSKGKKYKIKLKSNNYFPYNIIELPVGVIDDQKYILIESKKQLKAYKIIFPQLEIIESNDSKVTITNNDGKEDLKKLPKADLVKKATKLGLQSASSLKKTELVNWITLKLSKEFGD